jgi:phage terminase Nu1 subunit (DNA packaging protein)
MIVNRTGLADVFGVSLFTIDEWVRAHAPAVQRASKKPYKEWQFETSEIYQWLLDRAVKINNGDDVGENTMAEAKLRERAAIAGLRELELAERRGELVLIGDVAKRVEEEYAVVKSHLRAIPGRMAQPLSAESDPTKIENLLKAEVDCALDGLSNGG